MSKKKKSCYKPYVSHPRYGDKPIYSGNNYAIEDVLSAHWQYDKESIFPETAIPADIEKQNYSLYPQKIYVDIEKQCIQCNRWFIFYAQEQKYWYETLGFYIDADCVKCVECRKKEQEIRNLMHTYEDLIKKQKRSEEEINILKNTALELYQSL